MWVSQTLVQNEPFSKNGWILQFYTQNSDMKQLIDHVHWIMTRLHWIMTLWTVTLYTHFGSSNTVICNEIRSTKSTCLAEGYPWKIHKWQVPSDWMDMLAWSLRYEFPLIACPRVLGLQTVNLSFNEHIRWVQKRGCMLQYFTLKQPSPWGMGPSKPYLSRTLVLVSLVKRVWTHPVCSPTMACKPPTALAISSRTHDLKAALPRLIAKMLRHWMSTNYKSPHPPIRPSIYPICRLGEEL